MKQFTMVGSVGHDVVHMDGNPDDYSRAYSFGTVTFEKTDRKYIITDMESMSFPTPSPIDGKSFFNWVDVKNTFMDITPEILTSFDNVSNIGISSSFTTNVLTITGMNDFATVSITPTANIYINGSLKTGFINVKNNDTLYIGGTSSSSNSETTNYTVSIGGTDKTFSVTTKDDVVHKTCKDLFDNGNTTNGTYTVQPFANEVTTKEVYCDMINGGWMLIDDSFPYYAGRECSPGYGLIDANDIWKLSIDGTSDNPWGSTSHGGCGITINKKIPFSEIKLTDMSMYSNASCGSVPFPNPRIQMVEDNDGPVAAFSGYHYPGWGYESIDGSVIEQTSKSDLAGQTGTRTITADNGKQDYYIHFGIGAYSGCYGRHCSTKIWVR